MTDREPCATPGCPHERFHDGPCSWLVDPVLDTDVERDHEAGCSLDTDHPGRCIIAEDDYVPEAVFDTEQLLREDFSTAFATANEAVDQLRHHIDVAIGALANISHLNRQLGPGRRPIDYIHNDLEHLVEIRGHLARIIAGTTKANGPR